MYFNKRDVIDNVGQCQKSAPIGPMQFPTDPVTASSFAFPFVNKDDWCGDYAA
jgi:hypothetical protein